MRTVVIWGVALVCLVVIVSQQQDLGAQRGAPPVPAAAAGTKPPSSVEVTNFPSIQGVAGTVNVGNLPQVQSVTGTVTVGNLPQPAGPVHFRGYTTRRFLNYTPYAALNGACGQDVPGTRICTADEFNLGLPPGPFQANDPCILFAGLSGIDSVVQIFGQGAGIGVIMDLDNGMANFCDEAGGTYRVACCGS